jgi:S1-C subfamily serine protease
MGMTESFRSSGEHDPQGDGRQQALHPRQHASSPVSPEWPPPPAYAPAADGHGTAGHVGATYGHTGPGGPGGPGAAAYGDTGPAGHGGGTAVLSAVPAAPQPGRRTRGPASLLAAVAIVAAAVGGGTAYGIQELTGTGTVASSSTSTHVIPSSQRGSIAAIAKAVSPSVVQVNATSGAGESTGSGVIVTGDGEVVTNNHVISGASSIKVTTSSGKSYTAKVVGTDSGKDLALVKLEGAAGLKAATLGNSDGLRVGDQVVAIGSPEGLTGTVTSGIVSALDRDVTVPVESDPGRQQDQQDGGWPFEFGGRQFNGDTGSRTTTYKAIQTDASLNPGNSGGALIDMNGNVVGINSAMYSPSSTSSSSSSDAGSVGLGFAIPVNTVKADLAKLRAGSTD